jgi:hypothetical protein
MFRKLIGIIVFILALVLVFDAVQWYQTKQALVSFCRETTAGTSLAGARERASSKGLRFVGSSAGRRRGVALVTATGVMGRYVCEIEYDGDRVVRSSLHLLD